MDWQLVLALLSGIAIAAACGLRAFLPLLLLGLAARFHLIGLASQVDWLDSDLALWTLGIATALELIGDKVPIVDHALDVLGSVLRPLAAALGAYAALVQWPTAAAAAIAGLLGIGAFTVSMAKAKVRLGSSALTLGHANPLLSFGEDGLVIGLMVTAVLLPLLVLVPLALFLVLLRRRRRRAVVLTQSLDARS